MKTNRKLYAFSATFRRHRQILIDNRPKREFNVHLMYIVIPRTRLIAVPVVALLALLVFTLDSKGAIKAGECLECHDAYKNSSHGGTTCIDCHASITSLPHADKLPKPECVTCHRGTVGVFNESVHRRAGLVCGQCHTVHLIDQEKKYCASCHATVAHSSLPSQKKHLSNLACVGCHGKASRTGMTVRVDMNGQQVNVAQIDRDGNHFVTRAEWHAFDDLLRTRHKGAYRITKIYRIEADPHSVVETPVRCDACHGEAGYFQSAELQVAGSTSFTVRIDPSIFVPELPAAEEFGRTAHGIAGVRCVDCHEVQKNAPEGWSVNSTICSQCHEDIESVYSASIHSKNGATRCVDCHNPHRIKPYKELSAEDRVAVCSRCHGDYLRRHGWLPNTSLHFDYLECATCHSPRSQKSMVFYFAEKRAGKKSPLDYDRLVALYGSDPASALNENQGAATADTKIGNLFTTLLGRDRNLVIDASIIVTRVYHDYSETRPREKACVTCHSSEARFYDSMFFILPGRTAPDYIPVKGTLISTYPIGGFVDVFLLGADKIRKVDLYTFLGKGAAGQRRQAPGFGFKLIDFFGLLVVTLILLVIVGHVILRVVIKR